MTWVGVAVAVTVLVFLGLYLLLGVAIFVTHLVERRPLRFLVPAAADDPEWSRLPAQATKRPPAAASDNPYEAPAAADYAVVNNAAPAALGFVPSGLYAHAKGGTYRTHAVLWESPSREILAFVGWGTIASINSDKTVLYSALDDGRFLVTSAKPTGAETPGLYENLVVVGAPFDRLVGRHEQRLRDCGRRVLPFRGEDLLADYEGIQERRFRFLVETGDAYFIEPDGDSIRSTLKGAFKAYLRTLRPPAGIEREGAPAAAGGVGITPALLVKFERLCYMTLAAAFVLNIRGKATTGRQQIFRVSLLGGSLVGLAAVYTLRATLGRRSRSTDS